MFTEMIETLKEKDKKEEYYSTIYREGNYKDNLNNFIDFLIKYFDVDTLSKKYEENDTIVSRRLLVTELFFTT